MPYTVHIKKTATGEVRAVIEEGAWGENEPIWTEGNFSCDCNRHLFFERVVGIEPPDDEVPGCYSDPDLYRISVTENGKTVYSEIMATKEEV